MKNDDLYARHQTLVALVNVLLHDLRNPLHSATLLVEAMGSRAADLDSIRGKLRSQFGKLEGLISEATGSIRDLSLEPRIERVEVDELLRSAVSQLEQAAIEAGEPSPFQISSPTGLGITTDRAILTQAIVEIAATVAEYEHEARGHTKIMLTVEQPDSETVKISVGGDLASLAPTVAKAPFAIAGGGIRLALARALCQSAATTLRLEQLPENCWRFGITARRQA